MYNFYFPAESALRGLALKFDYAIGEISNESGVSNKQLQLKYIISVST